MKPVRQLSCAGLMVLACLGCTSTGQAPARAPSTEAADASPLSPPSPTFNGPPGKEGPVVDPTASGPTIMPEAEQKFLLAIEDEAGDLTVKTQPILDIAYGVCTRTAIDWPDTAVAAWVQESIEDAYPKIPAPVDQDVITSIIDASRQYLCA